MMQDIILGTIQGITEWLPISSEGAIIFVKVNIFHSTDSIKTLVRYALILHLGTFLAALLYFRKDVLKLIKATIFLKKAEAETKNILKFLLLATFTSGAIGGILFNTIITTDIPGKILTLSIGVLLLLTAFLQFKSKKQEKLKTLNSLMLKDGLILGLTQGFSVLPGFSRSGSTISVLLMRKFNDEVALRLSFLMSLPIVLAGNIVLNFKNFAFSLRMLWALLASFVFGILTIKFLLKLSRKVNFAYFVLIFASLTFLSLII